MLSAGADKHLKFLMDMEERQEEQEVAARVEQRKHEERIMQAMLTVHQAQPQPHPMAM